MSKKNDEFGELAFREKPDIGGAFIRQVDRCNQAAILDPDSHQSSVYQTLAMLPSKWRAWVYAQEDRYTDYEPRFIIKTYQGHEIGTKENPHLIDDTKPVRRLIGPIDWEDPNIKGRKNVGTKDEPEYEPVLVDESKPVRRLEGSIDWDDPNIFSPKLDTSPPPINFQAFNELVMEAAEQAGLTWNVDLEEVDAGDTDEHIDRVKTPWRAPEEDDDE